MNEKFCVIPPILTIDVQYWSIGKLIRKQFTKAEMKKIDVTFVFYKKY